MLKDPFFSSDLLFFSPIIHTVYYKSNSGSGTRSYGIVFSSAFRDARNYSDLEEEAEADFGFALQITRGFFDSWLSIICRSFFLFASAAFQE